MIKKQIYKNLSVLNNHSEDSVMEMVHITIQTPGFEEEIAFYETYAGLSIQRDMRSVGKELVFLGNRNESTMLEIIHNKEAPEYENTYLSIGFHTDDLDSIREKLISAGLDPTPFITPIPGVRFFYVRDPAGVNVQFIDAFYLNN